MTEHCIIVGGSHAATQLCASLRLEGWAGDITLISEDQYPPYHRPPLSKTALSGDKPDAELQIRPREFYQKNNIALRLNSRVVGINRASKIVAFENGETMPYTKLALATGARVRQLSISGSDKEGVCYLRDLADAQKIRNLIAPDKSAVIIGGGYVGLEAAASLRKLGMTVTVLEAQERILARVTAPEISAFYTRIHSEEGVKIVTEADVALLEGGKQVSGVRLASGEIIAADLVLIGVGVLPNTELAEGSGLETSNGIVVDDHGRTTDGDIVAVGDCTNHYNPIYQRRLRLESVQNANDQAKIAAKTICGKQESYCALPWFWSDQYDLKLQIAGLSQGFDNVVLRGDTHAGRSFAAFYFSGEKLLAVDAINRPREFMMAKRFLAEGKSVDPLKVADEKLDIKAIFVTHNEC